MNTIIILFFGFFFIFLILLRYISKEWLYSFAAAIILLFLSLGIYTDGIQYKTGSITNTTNEYNGSLVTNFTSTESYQYVDGSGSYKNYIGLITLLLSIALFWESIYTARKGDD